MPVVYLQPAGNRSDRKRGISITSAVDGFAKTHNLRVSHDADGQVWNLCFEHPRGGHVRIEVSAAAGDVLRVVSLWWQDDYDTFRRNIRRSVAAPTGMTRAALLSALDDELTRVLSWQPGEWTEFDTGYEAQWSWFTKHEFEQGVTASSWPRPRLEH